ncbi:hypothetical protein DASC09_013290 [Saccharomycopsis crataegensis]|uniref:Beta-xylosidase C-terminal Concanavalin A-like domain-containing protein n=1 Tax=Saccharomycopsis crataegensis TaxID=43959 RepID=A0AAV5QHZ3_9ASCO|nr:hypothetical protein DASC09_013290 [Saccharomycopsis crataegensis]
MDQFSNLMSRHHQMIINNPIISGFSPDPTICQVDGVYYLANSSFQFFPGIPIYASTDLANWTHIGNGLNRHSQVDLSKVTTIIQTYSDVHDDAKPFIYNWGIAAPTIRYHQGRFYIICTCVNPRPNDKEYINFVISTDNIYQESSWSDPVFFEFQGIDPDLFFEDGKAYVTGSYTYHPRIEGQARTTIKQFELDIDTGEKLSQEREIWKGWSGCRVVPEGPHIYKKNGWYYCLVSDGGTFTHHMLTIARSKTIDGPYEESPNNPIFTADPSGEFTAPVLNESGEPDYIQYTGHGDFFQVQDDGSWWCVFLAVRFENGKHPMGRESFIVRIDWSGEWPKFDNKVSLKLEGPKFDNTPGKLEVMKQDNKLEYLFIKNPCLSNYRIGKGRIEIQPSKADLVDEAVGISFIGVRQRQLSEIAKVTMQISNDGRVKSGICLFKDLYRVFEVGYRSDTRKVYFQSRGLPNNIRYGEADYGDAGGGGRLSLRIVADRDTYRFEYFDHHHRWVELGRIDAGDVTAWDFTGTLFGLYAIGEGAAREFLGFEVR